MTASLATYFAFPGNTDEVLTHWQEVLGGELELVRYGDMQLEGMPFEPDPQSVAHATLTLPVGVIAGSDSMDDRDYPLRDTAYSMLYTTDTVDEARGFFNAFVEQGGSVGMPFERAPWGDWYGQVFDRYGVMWAFSCEAGE
ncbi:VOC family protein [Leucobacter denitrificans]|uniref:VOC family protein n=1 Tax=Leucobacter denitrificans TaxID=683042 RepID=A0A7G9S6V6_9MICO|nr:VOC family protein [Leucobacter denitrificans]QNN63581.1 VOC family protein [Leucobacter denitrificans]